MCRARTKRAENTDPKAGVFQSFRRTERGRKTISFAAWFENIQGKHEARSPSDSHGWGATWSAPRTLVSGRARRWYPGSRAPQGSEGSRSSLVSTARARKGTTGQRKPRPFGASGLRTTCRARRRGSTTGRHVLGALKTAGTPAVAKTRTICTDGNGDVEAKKTAGLATSSRSRFDNQGQRGYGPWVRGRSTTRREEQPRCAFHATSGKAEGTSRGPNRGKPTV